MCVLFSYFLIGFCFGTAVTRQADIDINRIKLLSNEAYPEDQPDPRRYPEKYYNLKRSNDYDDNSGRFVQPRAQVQPLHDASPVSTPKTLQVYRPRQDPRLFYQSDAYIKENNRKNVDLAVSSVYPGTDVIRADDSLYEPPSLAMRSRRPNRRNAHYRNLCVKCPHDRTLIVKPGSDRVLLQHPRLTTCSGAKAPRDVKFSSLYGSKFGSLISQGSHVIIGQITQRGKNIQMCKMEVHVILQTCSVPSYLISKCDDRTKVCNLSCRDPKLELHGHSVLSCGDNMGWMGWTGNLPLCRARSWCERPPAPDHGRLSCKGSPEGTGLAEGSTCRVRCARGWRWSPRVATACRRGAWTIDINCIPKRAT